MGVSEPLDEVLGTPRAAFDAIGLDVFRSAIESVRPLVLSRLVAVGRSSDADIVMQDIRVTAWETCDRYDSSVGGFGAFVNGIAGRVLMRVNDSDARYRRANHVPIDDLREIPQIREEDPGVYVEAEEYRRRCFEHLAAFIDVDDWAVVVALAQGEVTASDVATQFAMSVRTVRTIRERVTLTGQTIRNAMHAVDEGAHVTTATIRDCVPAVGHLREIARFLLDDCEDLTAMAAATGVSTSRRRHRLPTARRLLGIANQIVSGGDRQR